jgi:multidrug transporter EmrE-like cation transporter
MARGYIWASRALLEIVWASAMKLPEGFTKLWPTIISLSGHGREP